MNYILNYVAESSYVILSKFMKANIKSFLAVFLCACMGILSSCDDEQEDFVRDVAIEMSISDVKGNDLLNPETTGAFRFEDIDLFYLKNGQKERVYDAYMDNPKNFFIFKSGSKYYMRLFPNEHIENGFATTYIQFNESETDTIQCEFAKPPNKNSGYISVFRVWYNGKIVWDGEGSRYFEVIK